MPCSSARATTAGRGATRSRWRGPCATTGPPRPPTPPRAPGRSRPDRRRFHPPAPAPPGLGGVEGDASSLDPGALDTDEEIGARPRFPARNLSRALLIVAGAVLLAGLINGLAWRRGDGVARARPVAPAVVTPVAGLP